jgi:hypothetical protein
MDRWWRTHLALVGAVLAWAGIPRVSAGQRGSQPPIAPLPTDTFSLAASAITWRGPLGYNAAEPRFIYVLLTRGFMRAPTSIDFDSLVDTWQRAHPKARAVVVSVVRPVVADDPGSQARAVWLIDGAANLNVELVRAGACPGSNMKLSELGQTLVARAVYEPFAAQIDSAEADAKREHRGIWSATGR